jgi:hypothetical protein
MAVGESVLQAIRAAGLYPTAFERCSICTEGIVTLNYDRILLLFFRPGWSHLGRPFSINLNLDEAAINATVQNGPDLAASFLGSKISWGPNVRVSRVI